MNRFDLKFIKIQNMLGKTLMKYRAIDFFKNFHKMLENKKSRVHPVHFLKVLRTNLPQ